MSLHSNFRGYFEKNIGVSKEDCLGEKGCHQGFVVAAPTNNNPDYYYHWQRDAGVSMHVLQYTANSSDTSWDKKFQDYVQWVVTVQTEKDPNNINVLGEPKFNPDASVYSSGWCRPQNEYVIWFMPNQFDPIHSFQTGTSHITVIYT